MILFIGLVLVGMITIFLLAHSQAQNDKLPEKKRGKSEQDSMPILGTIIPPLPEGDGKKEVEESCLKCHSTEMLLQQKLTEKQWTAVVEKMIKWGAEVPENEKTKIISYLIKNFGSDNNRFEPIVTQSVE